MTYSKYLIFVVLPGLFSSCDMRAVRDEADLLFQNGEYKAAAARYDRVIKINPEDHFALFNRGRAREEIGDHEGAYDDFTQLISRHKYTRMALLARGRCSFNMENYKGVVMDMNTLLRVDPDNIEALRLRGSSYVKLGKPLLKAINDLGRVIDKRPQDVQALISRGAAYARLGMGPRGIEDFNRALSVDPGLPVAHFNKGVVFFTHEYWSEALRNFENAIRLNKNYKEAYTRRGMTKLQSDRFTTDQACADFKIAHEMGDELAAEYLKSFCH